MESRKARREATHEKQPQAVKPAKDSRVAVSPVRRLWPSILAVTAVVGVILTWKTVIPLLRELMVWLDTLLFAGRINAILVTRPGWFFHKLGYIALLTAAASALVAFLWRPGSSRKNLSLGWKITGSMSAVLVVAIAAIGLASEWRRPIDHPYPRQDAAVVCPQCAQMGTCAVFTYANNGGVSYQIDIHGEPAGTPGFARITLQAYLADEGHSAGWAIFMQPGIDLSDFNNLCFKIKGEKGNEHIGVKAKDAHSVEESVLVDNPYIVEERSITRKWSNVCIPLIAFPHVDFGLMSNVSLYVDGRMAGALPQTIYVGGIEWRKLAPAERP